MQGNGILTKLLGCNAYALYRIRSMSPHSNISLGKRTLINMPRKLHLVQTDVRYVPIGSNPLYNSKEEIKKDYESFQQNIYLYT